MAALPRITVNPVLRRELVVRMRGWRACAVLTVYLALLAGSLYLAYRAGRNTVASNERFILEQGPGGFDAGGGFGAAASVSGAAAVGRGIFEWLLFLMLMLVLFLVPGQTSGAVAGERERQTLVPLQVTLLRPRSIVLGKIGAALAFLVLMIVATLPFLAICYLIGGVTMGEVLGGVALVLFVGLVVACLSTAISAFARRVQFATVLCYGVVLFLLVGTLFVRAAASAYDSSRGTDEANPPSWLLLPNPLAMVADVVDDGEDRFGQTESPFDGMEDMVRRDEGGGFGSGSDSGSAIAVGRDDIAVAVEANGGIIQPLPGGDFVDVIGEEELDEFGNPVDNGEKSSFWWQSMLLLGSLALLAVVAGARRLRTPAAAER